MGAADIVELRRIVILAYTFVEKWVDEHCGKCKTNLSAVLRGHAV